MSWSFAPSLGDGPGEYCASDCQHRDCAATRDLLASTCRICGEPIKSGDQIVYEGTSGTSAVHFTCALDEADAEIRAQAAARGIVQ